ncbi:nuclear transport factor 2 family protein [Glycomyces harbinensis]|uniref:Predicted SnoaL-like aldol condensation-catalyzing enzyme n=1 Tax=Glycomyces harbinensis TaxID=58114 RepID=A0A1G7C036_9ACTN|nr:nuclear transport factor 2 family protein [Glycomyces harbinensis]SDE32718.1 Predicted SnoaL-like aldol condensation-catalyzing enzyme [Glycomyces harbinensis]
MTTDKKQIIRTALAELFGSGGTDALEPYLKDDFTDRGPGIVASGKDEWLEAVRRIPAADMKIEIRLLLEDGDHVTMLSRRWLPWAGHWIAAADVWRFEGDRIAEHVEVFQPIPEDAAAPVPHSLMP